MLDNLQKSLEAAFIARLYPRIEELSGNHAHFSYRRRGCHTAIKQYFDVTNEYASRKVPQYNAFIDFKSA
jgi:hypothetical protein